MSCTNYFINLVSLVPDSFREITIDNLSPAGWYVLYPPSNQPTQTPLPFYLPTILNTQERAKYLGYTTNQPVNCVGGSNYPVGKMRLLYQRCEDSPTRFAGFGGSVEPIDKDVLEVVGNVVQVGKKLTGKRKQLASPIPHNTKELYCLYTAGNNGKPIKSESFINSNNPTSSDFQDWFVGHIHYKIPPAGVIVNSQIFGTPFTANLRYIGTLRGLHPDVGFSPRILRDDVKPELVDDDLYPVNQLVTLDTSNAQKFLLFNLPPNTLININSLDGQPLTGSILSNNVELLAVPVGVTGFGSPEISSNTISLKTLTFSSRLNVIGISNSQILVSVGNQDFPILL